MQELADLGERICHQSFFSVQKDKSADFHSLVFSLKCCSSDFQESEWVDTILSSFLYVIKAGCEDFLFIPGNSGRSSWTTFQECDVSNPVHLQVETEVLEDKVCLMAVYGNE